MKILLTVRREGAPSDPNPVFWVEDAVDEDTLVDAGMPTSITEALQRDPANIRTLWVQIPDGALSAAFETPTVTGGLVDPTQ